MGFKPKFKCTILSPNQLLYENEVHSIFITGDQGEYEFMAYHYPVIGVVKRSDVVINWTDKIAINGGVVRFFANECTILAEEPIKPVGKK